MPQLDSALHRGLDLGHRDAAACARDDDLTMAGGLERKPEAARRFDDPRRLDRPGLAGRRRLEDGRPGGGARHAFGEVRERQHVRADRDLAFEAKPLGREGRGEDEAERGRDRGDAQDDHRAYPAGARRAEGRDGGVEAHRAVS
jgi:hypothetical protein